MNNENYASLEASKKLTDAGIILETEAIWCQYQDCETSELSWELEYNDGSFGPEIFPAPSIAEVWKELPEEFESYGRLCALQVAKISVNGIAHTSAQYVYHDDTYGEMVQHFNANINPTDALIDLLIWYKKEALNP